MQEDSRRRIAALTAHPGWKDLEVVILEQRDEARNFLLHLMDSDPDKLTGKRAVSLAARAKSLDDLMDSVEDCKKEK